MTSYKLKKFSRPHYIKSEKPPVRLTNFGLLEGGRVVDTVTSHGRDLAVRLQVLDNLLLVSWLDTRKQPEYINQVQSINQ